MTNHELLAQQREMIRQGMEYTRARQREKHDAAVRQAVSDVHFSLAGNAMMLAVFHPDAKLSAQCFGDYLRHTHNGIMALAPTATP